MKYRIWTWFAFEQNEDFRDTGYFLQLRHVDKNSSSDTVLTFPNVAQAKRCAEANCTSNYVIMMDAQEVVYK